MSDFKVHEIVEKVKSHKEREADKLIFNVSINKGVNFIEGYENNILNCDFFSLPQNNSCRFVATIIDEADAFTLDMFNVAVIPADLFRILTQKYLSNKKRIEAIDHYKKLLPSVPRETGDGDE